MVKFISNHEVDKLKLNNGEFNKKKTEEKGKKRHSEEELD